MNSTFTDFIETIFGQYQPIIVYDGNNIPVDTAINFGYIASVILLLVFVIYVLKTVGGVIYEWLR